MADKQDSTRPRQSRDTKSVPLLCHLGLHRWKGWHYDIENYYVYGCRICARCGLADFVEGPIANARRKTYE